MVPQYRNTEGLAHTNLANLLKSAGEPVEARQCLVGDKPEEAHVLVQLVTVHGAPQCRVFRDLIADDQQLHLLEAASPE